MLITYCLIIISILRSKQSTGSQPRALQKDHNNNVQRFNGTDEDEFDLNPETQARYKLYLA